LVGHRVVFLRNGRDVEIQEGVPCFLNAKINTPENGQEVAADSRKCLVGLPPHNCFLKK
jgi:hypothetical protein